ISDIPDRAVPGNTSPWRAATVARPECVAPWLSPPGLDWNGPPPAHAGANEPTAPCASTSKAPGLGARQLHHPRFVGTANERSPRSMKGILQTRLHSHIQRFMHAMIDRQTADV